jgi:hypothetical protein
LSPGRQSGSQQPGTVAVNVVWLVLDLGGLAPARWISALSGSIAIVIVLARRDRLEVSRNGCAVHSAAAN